MTTERLECGHAVCGECNERFMCIPSIREYAEWQFEGEIGAAVCVQCIAQNTPCDTSALQSVLATELPEWQGRFEAMREKAKKAIQEAVDGVEQDADRAIKCLIARNAKLDEIMPLIRTAITVMMEVLDIAEEEKCMGVVGLIEKTVMCLMRQFPGIAIEVKSHNIEALETHNKTIVTFDDNRT